MNLFDSKIKGLFGSIQREYFNTQQKQRIEQSALLYNFYQNDYNEIKKELESRMSKGSLGVFKQETIDRFPSFNYVNPIPKIVNHLCTAYKDEPIRDISDAEIEDAIDIFYNIIDRYKYNKTLQEIEKLTFLFGNIYVMPVIRDGLFDLDILYPFQTEIFYDEDNPYKIKEVAILNQEFNPQENKYEKYIIVWTETEHYRLNEFLEKQAITIDGKSNNFVNPFGIVPIIELNFRDSNLLWLIDHAIDLSIHQIWLSYNTLFHIGGIPVLTNFEPEPDYYQEDIKISGHTFRKKGNAENNVRIAADSILILNNSDPQKESKFNYVSPQSNIQSLSVFEEWKKKNLFSDMNINPNLASFERASASGYSKMMDELETINVRQQHLPILKHFESELYNLIKIIALKELQINLVGKLWIDYKEISFPKSLQEKSEERRIALELNLKTPIDFIIEDNPDLSWEEAKEIYEENKKINQGSLTFDMSEDMPTEMESEMEFDIPDLRQWSDYDCGVSALNSILQYYGIDYNGEELSKELGTTKDFGTDENMIVSVAEKNGLEVDKREMTIDILKEFLSKKIPVILDIQAWHGVENYDYTNEYADGHYVVAKGFDKENILIEDPSSIGTAKISYSELEKRWHDIDKDNNKLQNLGIAIIGTPKQRGYESIG